MRVRLEVGSSMMSRRASSERALAISTSCICASDSSATGVSGPKSTPRRSRIGRTVRAQCRPVDQLQRPAIARLAAEEDIGRDVEIVEQVQLLMDEGDAGRNRLADREPVTVGPVDPDRAGRSAAVTPPRIFISVDLPAPFSPIRPSTSPPCSARSTPPSATTPG